MGDSRGLTDRNVWDTAYESDDESTYECFKCSTLLSENGSPVSCPECGGQLRNREMPIE